MKKLVSFVLIVMLVAFVTEAVLGQSRHHTIAAVSFQNNTGDESLDHLKSTIPDQIIVLLGRGGNLRIVDRAAIERAIIELKSGLTENIAAQIGKQFGATAIIAGSISKWSERTFSITARLVSTETGLVIAAESVQGPRDELLPLCNEIAVSFRNVLLKPPPPKSKSVFKKWWFWGGVALSAGAAYALTRGGEEFSDVDIIITMP